MNSICDSAISKYDEIFLLFHWRQLKNKKYFNKEYTKNVKKSIKSLFRRLHCKYRNKLEEINMWDIKIKEKIRSLISFCVQRWIGLRFLFERK